MSELVLRNRQRSRRVNTRLLRQIIDAALASIPDVKEHELGVHLVGAAEMARVNHDYLNHEGSTDVVTFDHSEETSRTTHHAPRLHGEIFVCVDESIRQARQFGTNWQSEVVRYVVHGVLHLLGHDHQQEDDARRMEALETEIVTGLGYPDPYRSQD